MKVWKIFSAVVGTLLGIAATGLMVWSVSLAFRSLDAPVQLTQVPQGAMDRSQQLMDAVAAGDFDTAGSILYGQSDLGVQGRPEDQLGQQLWDKFLKSISYEFTGECYATDSGISRDAVITTLDIANGAPGLKERIRKELDRRVAEAEDMSQLYDEQNNFREELVNEIYSQAVAEAVAEQTPTIRRQVTLNLIFRDGQWWVVPDQALLRAISGNMAG